MQKKRRKEGKNKLSIKTATKTSAKKQKYKLRRRQLSYNTRRSSSGQNLSICVEETMEKRANPFIKTNGPPNMFCAVLQIYNIRLANSNITY